MQRPRLEAAVLSPHRRSTLAETYTAGLSPTGINAQVRAKWECRTGLAKSYRRSQATPACELVPMPDATRRKLESSFERRSRERWPELGSISVRTRSEPDCRVRRAAD